ncbi:MAG TPA: cytochrome P450 [Nevskiaceae bacterium]|nr:cytochrome P450 [Nevskiaceae bacterium]
MAADADGGSRLDTAGYDPLDAADLSDPYRHYRRLREQCPVAWSNRLGAHIVSRHQDIKSICRQPELFSNEGTIDAGFGDVKFLVMADDPLHRRQRNLVDQVFTLQRVALLEPFLEELADRLIDGFVADGTCDLVQRFSLMIPANVIARMLGVPVEDVDKFKRWAEDGIRAAANQEQYLEQAMVSALELGEYVTAAVELRKPAIERGEPGDDLLTALITAEVDGNRLEPIELFFVVWQLLTAGHETTTSLISSAVALLSAHPEQRALLLADPGLIEQAVEEVLRFEGPAQAMPRIAKQDLALHGQTIKAGEKVTVMFGSGNRDPDIWADPDRFDITRPLADTRRKQMAFGVGTHACLGANLARLEGRVALRRLLARIPDIAVDPARPGQRASTHYVRGWEHLWVKWTPRAEDQAR